MPTHISTQHVLTLAISTILTCSIPRSSVAELSDPIFELSDLNSLNGFVLNGVARNDQSGFSVKGAGDINGDGVDDLLIGALGADPNGSYSGASYVVFGASSGLPNPFELSMLNGFNGIVLNGVTAGDGSGRSASAAGDINGDGIDDLLIGASGADPNGSFSGASYVVFGASSGLPHPFELSSLNGVNGIVLNGVTAGDGFGRSASAAGDINGDGIDDLLIGASGVDSNGGDSGASYVVFGASNGLPHPFEMSSLNGLNGFVLNGVGVLDQAGRSVSAAGDINGDGLDDLLIGASRADPNGSNSGASYVVFGASSGLPHPFELSSVNGFNGIVLNGMQADDYAGFSVSAAGDVNGDGIDDLLIGAPGGGPNDSNSGVSYVVFGARSGLPNPFELSNLNGFNGIVLNGVQADDYAGFSVSAAGDVNGDGIDDLLIGAFGADPNGSLSGASYVVFGASSGLPSLFDLSSLNGLNGFILNGVVAGDRSGGSVSAAGDINSDGIDDLLIGAYAADPNSNVSGASYVVFGKVSVDIAIRKTNGVSFVDPLDTLIYTITVSNQTAANVLSATVEDILPTTLNSLDAIWRCSPSGGATCSASGSGDITDTVDLPGFAEIAYILSAEVLATEGQDIINTATVSLSDGFVDSDTSNNSATDSDAVGLLVDSFENLLDE